MRALFTRSLLLVFALCTVGPAISQSIFINEFLASNSNTLADGHGEFDDWVELYNAGPVPVNIAGMYLTDDLTAPAQSKIPSTSPAATTIPPGGHLLLWFDKQMEQGPLHVDAKLSAGGEDIGLFAADGATQIDGLTFGPQSSDVSYGRSPDGGANFGSFNQPTPGATNIPAPGSEPAATPTATIGGGFFNYPVRVTWATTTPGASIRYTLDGSEPGAASPLYTGPLDIAATTTLRARAFAQGLLPSKTATHTYLLEPKHTFPVVALSFKDEDFFDPATGIYPNYEQDLERPVHVEFFEESGALGFSKDAAVEIHGTGSGGLPQKSLKIKAGSGQDAVQYPLFPGLPFETYRSFLLRNSGQDWNVTMFRDAFITGLVGDLGDLGGIIRPPKLYLQAFRPGVAYLNGKYWGIHNLREHLTENYVEQHFGLKDNEIDLLENDNEVRAGDFDAWYSMKAFMEANNFANDAKMAELGAMLDLPHFLDYNLFNIVTDNPDWPGNNYRRFRERKAGARWQFLTFDFDLAFGLLDLKPGSFLWNTGSASNNSLARALNSTANDWPNPTWSTLPFRKVMENAAFRRDFINRAADFLNVLFSPQRVQARIDEFVALYQPEMQRHFNRWSDGWNPWAANIAILRKFANDRPAAMRQHIVQQFGEATGTANITLKTEPPGAGSIHLSTLTPGPAMLPWSGVYFTGVNIPAVAVPAPGYVFTGWSDPAMDAAASSSIKLSGNEILVAYFQKSTPGSPIVISEINYNPNSSQDSGDWVELCNATELAVDISGWVFQDESGVVFTIPIGTTMQPNSFLVLAENAAAFSNIYPQVSNFIGNFGGAAGFKLGNGGELIQLKDASPAVIDSVRYDDELPWNPAADGTGKTLQLISHDLDNALPQSWKVGPPTPGQPNSPIQLLAQTISFPAIPDKLTTDPPFDIPATATRLSDGQASGLPLGFTIDAGPATIAGSTITLTGAAGAVTVRASQAGNAQYSPAADVARTFQVVPPPVSDKPDLELSVGASSPELTVYQDITFLITLKNAGGKVADNIKVAGPVPAGLAFSSHLASKGTYNFNQENWIIGSLSPGESATLKLELLVLQNTTALPYFVQVKAATPADLDSAPGNNISGVPAEDDEALATIQPPVNIGQPNPGELLALFAEQSDLTVQLSWVSNTGHLSDHYEVEQSSDGLDWELLANRPNEDQTAQPFTYHQIVERPFPGLNFYRVKQFRHDGSVVLSNVLMIRFEVALDELLLFPNPARQYVNINLRPVAGRAVALSLVDQSGRVLKRERLEEAPAIPHRMELGPLPVGYYAVWVQVVGGRVLALPLVVAQD